MPKTAAKGVKFLRIEVSAKQMAEMKKAAYPRPLVRWALLALRNGLAFRGQLPTVYVERNKPRESLFLEVAPELLAKIDAHADSLAKNRTEFARACFAHAVGG